MATTFNHSATVVAGTSRTLLYGPVPVGQSVIVFAGLLANIDNANMVHHAATLETFNGTTYGMKLNKIPIPYGSSSMIPKMVLLPGESLYVTSDFANAIAASVEILVMQ